MVGVFPFFAGLGGGRRVMWVLNGDEDEAGKGVTRVTSTVVGPAVNREERRRSAGRSLPDMVTSF